MVFEHTRFYPNEFVQYVNKFFDECEVVMYLQQNNNFIVKPKTWKPPLAHVVKVNFDGSFIKQSLLIGIS